MQFRDVEINSIIFRMHDLGIDISAAFEKYYKSFMETNSIDIPNELNNQAIRFFDNFHTPQDYGRHDAFFNNFTFIWEILMRRGDYKRAQELWGRALQIAYDWHQKTKERIHKGTPYYFWGCTCILNDEIEKGFLLMHQGLMEDRDSWGKMPNPPTPNYWFVTLDFSQQKQFFIQKVKEIADFLDQKLNSYRISTIGHLTIQDFKRKFLENIDFKDLVFYFVFFLFRLRKLLTGIDSHIKENEFNSSLQARLLFDLCVIIDKIIEKENPNPPSGGSHLMYYGNLKFGSTVQSILKHTFQFGSTVQSILKHTFQFSDSSNFNSEIEENIALSYGFKNFGAHRMEDQPVFYQNFEAIADNVLRVLFFVIENLC